MKSHHSLYSRIAVGFVACLALLLLVQGLLFVWVVSRSAQAIPNQPPDRFAQTVALDVTQALEREPALDLSQYVRQEYARDAQPFFVLLKDGRAIEIGGPFPDGMINEARAHFEGLLQRGPVDGNNPDAQRRPFDNRNPDAQGRPFDNSNPDAQGRPYGRGRGEAFGR